jgi:Holliday junction resolvase-like predicted endonuclease
LPTKEKRNKRDAQKYAKQQCKNTDYRLDLVIVKKGTHFF